MKHREHLKELVKERTTELRMVNERLQPEITAREGAERAVQEAREYAESIVGTVREPLVVPTAYLKVVSAHYSFYNAFKK